MKKARLCLSNTTSPIVRMKGLEPPRPETLDPKSNAATNYATCAYGYVIHQIELDAYLAAKLDISILFSKLKLSDHTIFFTTY